MDILLLNLINGWLQRKNCGREYYYKDIMEEREKEFVTCLTHEQWEKFEDFRTSITDFVEEKTDYDKIDIFYLGLKLGMGFTDFLSDNKNLQ